MKTLKNIEDTYNPFIDISKMINTNSTYSKKKLHPKAIWLCTSNDKTLKSKKKLNLFIISWENIKMYTLQLNKTSHRKTNVLHTYISHKEEK